MQLTESYIAADGSVDLSEFTVGRLLSERAVSDPDVVALVGRTHDTGVLCRLTYRQLLGEAQRVAAALCALTEPGALVGIWAHNIVEWPIIQFGAAIAGRVLVAINPTLRQSELEYVLRHSGAAVLIHADDVNGYDTAAVAAAAAAAVPTVVHRISLADRGEWMAAPDAVDTVAFGPDAADSDAPVMLQYTSGTTGLPKGVLLRHRSLVNVAKLIIETCEIPQHSVFINPLPLFHTGGCVSAMLGPVWNAGTAVLVDKFAPATVLELATAENADVLFFVPTMLHALLEELRESPHAAPRFTACLGGAANIPRDMIEDATRIFGAHIHNVFGQTELSPVLTVTRRSDSIDDKLTTIGRPMPQVEVKIAGPDGTGVAAVGSPGEICARGYQQMIGYYRDPAATASAVDGEGWLHTGDLGSMDSRGFVTLAGRLKEIIISGGENIAPAEVESRLGEHELVQQAAVVGVPHPKWGETVAAVLVLRGDPPHDLIEVLDAHLSTRLTRFKMPRRWFVALGLPTTASGKVQKFKLRESIENGELRELT